MVRIEKLKLNIFFREALFFVLTQGLGLLIIFRLNKAPQIKAEIETSAPSLNPWYFLLNFLIATLVFLLFLPLLKKRGFFLKIFFILAIFAGLDVVIGVFSGEPLALIISLFLVLFVIFYPKVLVHNLIFSASLAGVGAILALSLTPYAVIIILTVLTFYDIIAVYFTKHMIKMAKIPASQGVFFGLLVPKDKKDFFKNKPSLNLGKKRAYFFLGGGDMVLPLVLSASVAKNNFLDGLIIAFFSFLGLLAMHLIFSLRKQKKPMPGLPPLVFFTLLGFLIVSLF